MKRILSAVGIALILSLCHISSHAQVGDLPRCTPAEQGIDPQAVNNFFDSLMAIPATDIHHVMVVRRGHVVAELHPTPYRPDDMHTLYSCSKTFTSMAIGLAIGENRLRTTDRVASFFPELLPDTITTWLSHITVRDLLIMASGIKPDWQMRNISNNWRAQFLAHPVAEEPGTHFQYDSMCSYMLSAIIQRVTGMNTLEYLRSRLFSPLGISTAEWEQSPEGIDVGGWGLRLQAESLAKIGMVMETGGKWDNANVLPARWIQVASAPHIYYSDVDRTVPTDKNQGYGYQIWRCRWPDAFRADGAYGQFIVAVPKSDLVVVILGHSNNTAAELNCIWNQLMPGVVDAFRTAANPKAQRALERFCANAALPMPKGKATAAAKNHRNFHATLADNRLHIASIRLDNDGNRLTITHSDGTSATYPMAHNRWTYTHITDTPIYDIEANARFSGLTSGFNAATAYAWTAPQTLQVQIEYVDWISSLGITIDLAARTATLTDIYHRNNPQTVAITLQ